MNWLANPKLRRCVPWLDAGGVIAYPTEAVWGLGCDPADQAAVHSVLALKQRPVEKGLILVAADMWQLEFLVWDLPAQLQDKLRQSWPGPNTWLIPHHERVPAWVTGRHPTVAVRVSDHPVVAALCSAFGGPLVSTSANPQGLPAARSQLAVRRYFRGQPLRYAPGVVGRRQSPSQIRDLISDQLVRP